MVDVSVLHSPGVPYIPWVFLTIRVPAFRSRCLRSVFLPPANTPA